MVTQRDVERAREFFHHRLGWGFQDQLSEIERQFIEQAICEKLERAAKEKP